MPTDRDPRAGLRTGGLLRLLTGVGERLLALPRPAVWGLVLGWAGLITWFSSWPARELPTSGATGITTNLGHALLFGLLCLWCALLMPRSGAGGPSAWPRLGRPARLYLVAFVAGLGLLDELHQHLAGRGRDFSLFDVLTDATGAWCVLAVAVYMRRSDAEDAGLAWRVLAAVLLCLAAAGIATWGPRLWPQAGWL